MVVPWTNTELGLDILHNNWWSVEDGCRDEQRTLQTTGASISYFQNCRRCHLTAVQPDLTPLTEDVGGRKTLRNDRPRLMKASSQCIHHRQLLNNLARVCFRLENLVRQSQL